MKEIIQLTRCDWCGEHIDSDGREDVELSFDGSFYELDLHLYCVATLYEQSLGDIVHRARQVKAPKTRAPKPKVSDSLRIRAYQRRYTLAEYAAYEMVSIAEDGTQTWRHPGCTKTFDHRQGLDTHLKGRHHGEPTTVATLLGELIAGSKSPSASQSA